MDTVSAISRTPRKAPCPAPQRQNTGDQVLLSRRPSPLRQFQIGVSGALAVLTMPVGSVILSRDCPPPPATRTVDPSNVWVTGMPGSDLTKTRLDDIAYSQAHGHLQPKQALLLRRELREMPMQGSQLVPKLIQFDNLYDSFRLPSEAKTGSNLASNAPPLKAQSVSVLINGFRAYDRNHDGSLSRQELTSALARQSLHGRAEAPAVAMRLEFGDLVAASKTKDSISFPAFKKYVITGAAGSELGRLTDVALFRQSHEPALKPLAQETFDSSLIQQHYQGSCVLLSTLIELPPDHLRKMIQDNGNGTYTVHFRDGRQATVSEVSEGERAYFATTTLGERWPAIFEKAVGAVLAKGRGGDYVDGGSAIPPNEAIKLMTGKTAVTRHIDALGPAGLRQFLIDEVGKGQPVVAATYTADASTGLLGHHAYAVKKFDPITNLVTLRNPHGGGVWHGSKLNKNGLFEMPVGEFYNYYHHITAVP